jgi:uncharacterized repeat protein (TIGR03803 family)
MIKRFCPLTFLAAVLLATLAQAQTFTTLYSFSGSDGSTPYASLIQGPSGNLYGTTNVGGDGSCNGGCGVVFNLTTNGKENVVYNFQGSDGQQPYTPLIRDGRGNIYGTTAVGGSSGNGTVFKIDAKGKFSVLYSFAGGAVDGCQPYQGLVMDKTGNLYGTTTFCGANNQGTVFKLTRSGKELILHSFTGGTTDGGYPFYGHLTIDKFGNLYGVTEQGGPINAGVLYELSNKGVSVFHGFTGGTTDGCYPEGSVVRDDAGNFYGTASQCGTNEVGTIWKVSKKGKETILHNFAGGTSDGCYPEAGVAMNSNGTLFGTTDFCGAQGDGALFKLNAKGKFTLLHSFDSSDGAKPQGEVLRTSNGVLFGTTMSGGANNVGTVWKYVP